MRGVYTAAYLAGLLELYARQRNEAELDLGKGFNLIAGTSTGAIIGLAAAFGTPMRDVVELYRNEGRRIFPVRLRRDLSVLLQLVTRPSHLRAGAAALRSALTSVFGATTLIDLYKSRGIAVSIPAVAMSNQRAWVFKTPHLGGSRDERFPLVDVCMATSAAPIYRSLAGIDDAVSGLGGQLVFADGGLWANNPVLVGLLDALQMAKSDQPIEVFAVGTCPRPEGESIEPRNFDRGLWGWKFGGDALQVGLSAQEFAFDHMARLFALAFGKLGKKVSVVRFPTGTVPADAIDYLDIDDTRPAAITRLIDQARADISVTKSACDDPNNAAGQLIKQLMFDLPVAARGGSDAA